MEIIVIVLLILLNGVFSMAEMALVSSRKFKLENERLKGNGNAKVAIELSENPNKFLSTVQIGITLIGILLGVYSGDTLTKDFVVIVNKVEVLAPYANTIASVLVVFIITFFSIVFGELLPKRLGLKFPESIALFIAKPMSLLSKIASPFVWLLTITNEMVLKLFGIKNDDNDLLTEEEIKSIIREGNEGGVIEEREHDIMKNVFELSDRRVNSLSTHRKEIVFLDLSDSYEHVRSIIIDSGYSTYPVTDQKNVDNIVGVVKMKSLFDMKQENFSLKNYLKPVIFVSENSYIYPLIESLQNHKSHIAITIDEFGSTQGLVTLNDIMDDLVGEIPDGADDVDDVQIVKRNENSWLIEGQCPIYEFERYFNLEVDEEIDNNYVTVSGLFFNETESLPKVGDKVEIGGLILEVIDKDGNRIDKIMASRKHKKEEAVD